MPENDDKSTSNGDAKTGHAMMVTPAELLKLIATNQIVVDSGATHNSFKTTDGLECFVKLNTNKGISMRTANGGKMLVTHYGFAQGLGRIMICPELDEDILSLSQLMRNNVTLTTTSGETPIMTLTTQNNKRITSVLNANEQFRIPRTALADFIIMPRQASAYLNVHKLTDADSSDEDLEQTLYDNKASLTGATTVEPQTTNVVTYTSEQRARALQV
jgi:hypothetical protein